MLIPLLLLSSILLGSTTSIEFFPRCDGLIEPSVLSIDKPLENIKADRGESIILKCAFYSSPQPSVHWYRDSKLVDSHQAPHFESLLTTNQLGQTIFESTYRIDCLDESTAGEYRCEATTPCSESVVTTSTVTIAKTSKFSRNTCSSLTASKPSLPPFISAFTLSRIEIPGGVAQLACRTRGTPAPNITWKKIEEDESLSPLLDKESYMQLHNGDLLVVGDESSITESFRCTARNENGVVHADATVIYMSP